MTSSIDRLAAALLMIVAGTEPGPSVYLALILLALGFVVDVFTRQRRDLAAGEAVRRATELPHADAARDPALRAAVRRAGLRECDVLDPRD